MVPLFHMPSFEEIFLTQRHKIWSQQTRKSTLSYGENPESLSDMGLVLYRDVTDTKTDGQT